MIVTLFKKEKMYCGVHESDESCQIYSLCIDQEEKSQS